MQLEELSNRFDSAMTTRDFDELLTLARECDRLLRLQVPAARVGGHNLEALTVGLERIAAQYLAAMTMVEEEKSNLREQMQQMQKSKTSTNAYLDVARNLSL